MFEPLALLLAVTLFGTPALNATGQPMRATLDATPERAPLRQHLVIREYGGGFAAPVRFYQRDMTKFLHLIVLDGHLQTFMHVHPALQRDGGFVLDLTLPHGGLWHLYADAIPQNFGRQVFRFDLSLSGSGTPKVARRVSSTARAGPYTVSLDRSSLPFGKTSMLVVRIAKNGKPAADLHPYLGARAHAVLIGTDLSYIHAHAMSAGMRTSAAASSMPGMAMPGAAGPSAAPTGDPCNQDADVGMSMVELPARARVSPSMAVMLAPTKPGRYYLWLQFRGGSTVYTAPFVLSVR